jgi:hypothetical protein
VEADRRRLSDRYARLAELAERGAELADSGRWEELELLNAGRDALMAGLPAQAPAEAADALRRAVAAEARIGSRLAAARNAAAARVLGFDDARRAVRGYAPAVAGGQLDQRG